MQNKVFFILPIKLFWSQGSLFNIKMIGKRPPSREKQSLSELNLWNTHYLGSEPTAIWCWYILILIYFSYRNYFKANVSKKRSKRKKRSTRRPGSETKNHLHPSYCTFMSSHDWFSWKYLKGLAVSTFVAAGHKYFILKKIIRFCDELPIILLMWHLFCKYIFKKKKPQIFQIYLLIVYKIDSFTGALNAIITGKLGMKDLSAYFPIF